MTNDTPDDQTKLRMQIKGMLDRRRLELAKLEIETEIVEEEIVELEESLRELEADGQ